MEVILKVLEKKEDLHIMTQYCGRQFQDRLIGEEKDDLAQVFTNKVDCDDSLKKAKLLNISLVDFILIQIIK